MTEAGRETADVGALLGKHERDARSAPPGSAGTADAMDIVVVAMRRIEVDHMRDVIDVEAPCGDIRRDERRDAAGLELRERPLTLILREVPVHRDRRNVVLAIELAREFVGAVLRTDEHEREPPFDVELLDEPIQLVVGC